MAKAQKTAGKKAPTKSQVYTELAEGAGITRKQVQSIFEHLEALVQKHLKKDGDTFTIPGLVKMTMRRKKATKGGETKVNQFTGQSYVTQPKPAKNDIRARVPKALKEKVQ
jgi:nucleoid DNA-binding protein